MDQQHTSADNYPDGISGWAFALRPLAFSRSAPPQTKPFQTSNAQRLRFPLLTALQCAGGAFWRLVGWRGLQSLELPKRGPDIGSAVRMDQVVAGQQRCPFFASCCWFTLQGRQLDWKQGVPFPLK